MRNRNIISALLIIVVAFSSFFGFAPLFQKLTDNTAQQFTSAIFGSIFASILTMFLLNKQSEMEERKEKSQRVFDEKVNLFKNIIDLLKKIFEDRKVTIDELNEIEFMLINLTMIAEDKTISKFQELYQYLLSDERIRDEEGSVIIDSIMIKGIDNKNILFQFTSLCRKELGLSEKELDSNLINALNESFKKSEKIQRYRSALDDLDWIKNNSRCSIEEQRDCLSLIERILDLSYTANSEGLLALEEIEIDYRYYYLKRWLQFIIDGTDPARVKELMRKEIVFGEYKGKELLEQVICHEGVLMIQEGAPRVRMYEHLITFLNTKILDELEIKKRQEYLKEEQEKSNKELELYLELKERIEKENILNKDTGKLDIIYSVDYDILKNLFYSYYRDSPESIVKAVKYSNEQILDKIFRDALDSRSIQIEFLQKLIDIEAEETEAIEIQEKLANKLKQMIELKKF